MWMDYNSMSNTKKLMDKYKIFFFCRWQAVGSKKFILHEKKVQGMAGYTVKKF